MPWERTRNVLSLDPADPDADRNLLDTNQLMMVLGLDVPVSSKEVAAGAVMQVNHLRELIRRLGASGWSTRGAFSFSPGFPANSFRIAVSRAYVDGLPVLEVGSNLNSSTLSQITLPAPPGSGSRNDLVFLEVFLVEVPGSTASAPTSINKPSTSALFKYGNVLYGGTNVEDDVNEVNFEIARRVQIQYRLRAVAGVDFTTYPKGVDDPTVTAHGPKENASPTAEPFAAASWDATLFVAGNGTVAAQGTLKTLDGRVYALPVAKVARTAGVTEIQSGDVTDLRTQWGGVSLANLLTAKGDLLSRSTTEPLVVPVGADGAALLGDASQTAGLTWQVLPFQCGRLQYVSATQIVLAPFNGRRIPLKVGSLWTLYTLPSAGLTAANTNVRINGSDGQNLAADTDYLVCLTDVNGTKVLEFIPLATGHGADTDMGVEIISGSPTRTLVGLIRTNSSAQFSYASTKWLVVSWLNRQARRPANPGQVSWSTTSSTFVEPGASDRIEWVMWADEVATIHVRGYGVNGSSSDHHNMGLGIDMTANVLQNHQYWNDANGVNEFPVGYSFATQLADGFHDARMLLRTGGGGGTAYAHCAMTGSVR